MKIIILGGYGVFGGRLVQLLANVEGLSIVIAGRSREKAEAFCEGFKGLARVAPLELDRADIAEALRVLHPDLLIDASGPFQAYGDDPYIVVKAAIAAAVDYLDFADAADFVAGVSQFDMDAQRSGIFVLSGVSSFPVLTAAVVRALSPDMDVRRITGGIAPSPYAGIGLNVMRAVVGYAGAPVKLHRDGQAATGIGVGESLRYTVSPPGRLPLRNLRYSLVDVPELQLLPRIYPDLQDIWIGAGPVPEILHRMLNFLARLRALLHLPSLAPFSRLFYRVLNLMKFGEHRGGMFIEVEGLKLGHSITRSWHLLAEGDDGPLIPSMAIEAIVRKMLDGVMPATGARPATEALELADYEHLFRGRTIFTGTRLEDDGEGSLYQRLLGAAFDEMPRQLQDLHQPANGDVWAGEAEVTASGGILGNLLAQIMGFPVKSGTTPVEVSFETTPDGAEIWRRAFGNERFSSRQAAGKGREERLLRESFGPICVALAILVKDEKLHLVARSWRFLGIPMPRALMPNGAAFEEVRNGRFTFDVEIAAPIFGRIVHYRGWLKPRR